MITCSQHYDCYNHGCFYVLDVFQLIAKGKDASDLFPAVVKNVVSKNIEVCCESEGEMGLFRTCINVSTKTAFILPEPHQKSGRTFIVYCILCKYVIVVWV